MDFHSEEIDIKLIPLEKTKEWVSLTIKKEQKELGHLSFIFCTDEYLLTINQEYLNHNTYTDIITFNYVEDKLISGDIFISIERVKENANQFTTSFQNELNRVIIHGVLHLIGYNDKTDLEAQEIRAKEDFYLTLHP
ncbi:MAG: rRNA maturation RNase YbeY [Flavobacteriales bacterium]|nr:rRNA maturation RNase YbeY [Flavobacteriales bacterium]